MAAAVAPADGAGFDFSLCKRNAQLLTRGVEGRAPIKTGTTICGVVFKVRRTTLHQLCACNRRHVTPLHGLSVASSHLDPKTDAVEDIAAHCALDAYACRHGSLAMCRMALSWG